MKQEVKMDDMKLEFCKDCKSQTPHARMSKSNIYYCTVCEAIRDTHITPSSILKNEGDKND